MARETQQQVQENRTDYRGNERTRTRSVLRVLVPALSLLLVFLVLDVHGLIHRLAELDGRVVLLAVGVGLLLVQLQIVVSAWRWCLTAQALGLPLTLNEAVREYYVAALLNQLLPGGVAGDAARVVRSRHKEGVSVAAHSVMLERLAGQFVLLVVAIAGLFLWPQLLSSQAPLSAWQLLLACVAVITVLTVLLRWLRRHRPDQTLSSVQRSVMRFVVDLVPAVRKVWLDDRGWLWQLGLSLVVLSSYVGVFVVCAVAVQTPLPVMATLTVLPLVLLSMSVPTAFGGLGVRELAAAATWPLMGLPAEAGVLTSLLYGAVSLLGSIPAVFWLMRRPPSS